MGVLRVADESLEEEVYSAGCRHCFNVEPWSPRELALAVHETAIHDPMLCELLGVPFCEVNWEPNLFGDLLRGIAADAGDARQYFNGSVGERLATAMSASIVNPRYDLQREAILQRFGQLTNKEILVLLHILQGKASGEIAADTGVSDNTIRSQRISALRKLGARTPIELATVLVTIGLQTFMDGNGELIDGKIA